MAKLRSTTVLGTLNVDGQIKNLERVEIISGEFVSGLYFNTEKTPNVRSFFSLTEDGEINTHEKVSLLKYLNENGDEISILDVHRVIGETLSDIVFYITVYSPVIEDDIGVYYTATYNEHLPGWQSFENPISINKTVSYTKNDVEEWNGLWVGRYGERNYPVIETVDVFNSKLPDSSYQFVKKDGTPLPESIYILADANTEFIQNSDSEENSNETRIKNLKTEISEVEVLSENYIKKEDFLKRIRFVD